MPKIRAHEITPERIHAERRSFIKTAAVAVTGWSVAHGVPGGLRSALAAKAFVTPEKGDKLTPFEQITTYNNFYEFGADKGDPSKNAHTLKTKPWKIAVEGFVKKPEVYDVDEFIKPFTAEERVYRLRCVEGWSMVIPWQGFPLGDLIKRLEPLSNAKFVEFHTLLNPEQMPGQRRPVLDWPYVEGLRMDEAMHPLSILATGLYGKPLPNQNGAPIRLVVPWKYGFKSAKSIVKIKFTDKQPMTSWAKSAPNEYGFYSNVNPDVAHPRWSQAQERRLGEGSLLDTLFNSKKVLRKTLMFNGYADQVAGLYAGLDLKKFF